MHYIAEVTVDLPRDDVLWLLADRGATSCGGLTSRCASQSPANRGGRVHRRA